MSSNGSSSLKRFSISGKPGAKLPLQKNTSSRQSFNRSGGNRLLFDDDDEQHENDKVEMVTGFEEGKLKSLNGEEEAKPLSITPLENVDWRSRKKTLYRPASGQELSFTASEPEVIDQSNQSYGLQIMSSKSTTTSSSNQTETETVVEQVRTRTEREKTIEEQALDALIRDAKNTNKDVDQSHLTITTIDESTAFRNDVANRPDETTMEDYERMPVEHFGAALLRGMGWSEGQGIGRNRKNAPLPKPFEPQRREALLGLGATPEDLKKSEKKNRRAVYDLKNINIFKKVSKYKDDRDEDRSSRESSRDRRDRDDSRDSRSRRDYDSRRDRDRDSKDRDRRRRRSRSRSRSRSPSRSSRRKHRRD